MVIYVNVWTVICGISLIAVIRMISLIAVIDHVVRPIMAIIITPRITVKIYTSCL